MSQSRREMPTMKSDFDDWDTDPDFIRDMDEEDQRWGSKRTVGSINMSQLIDEVRKDHKMRQEKFDHPSQHDHSHGFGGKFGVQHDRKDKSALDYDYHEKLSKHSSQEISRKYVSTTSSVIKSGSVSDAKKNFLERVERTSYSKNPPPKHEARHYETQSTRPSGSHLDKGGYNDQDPARSSAQTKSYNSSTAREETRETRSKLPADLPPAFKSMQEKIDSLRKMIKEEEVKKPELKRVTKSSVESSSIKRNGDEFISKFRADRPEEKAGFNSISGKPASTRSPVEQRELPRDSIKSLSKKFETISMENRENFQKMTEAKRKEFFDQIKTQVRETRKEFDGFDPIDDDRDDFDMAAMRREMRERMESSVQKAPTSLSAAPQRRNDQSTRPKIYTRREVTQEKTVSKIVKENDKVIQNETKRDVERTSSCHGSSDEEFESNLLPDHRGTRVIEHKLAGLPERNGSPVDRIKRQVPLVEPEVKGPGLMARTLYDYEANDDDELSFDVDDLITNIEKVDPGWYKGTITYNNGTIRRVGLFPANYVKLLNDTSEH